LERNHPDDGTLGRHQRQQNLAEWVIDMGKAHKGLQAFRKNGEQAAKQAQRIQQQAEQASDSGGGGESEKEAVQAGVRPYPVPPYPAQHQKKPGSEAKVDPAPLYDAPDYKGSEKLQNMVGLITGGDSGIGRAVAVLYAREGADVAVVYLNEHEDAAETKHAVEAEGRRCLLIPGDVANAHFCKSAVEQTVKAFGKLRHSREQCRLPGACRSHRGPV
jgi:short subunit dehydrogenase